MIFLLFRPFETEKNNFVFFGAAKKKRGALVSLSTRAAVLMERIARKKILLFFFFFGGGCLRSGETMEEMKGPGGPLLSTSRVFFLLLKWPQHEIVGISIMFL